MGARAIYCSQTTDPNSDVPVFEIQREDKFGSIRTLRRNLLLPIGSLPLGQSKSGAKPSADANSVRNPVKNARVKVSTARNFSAGEEDIDSETDSDIVVVP